MADGKWIVGLTPELAVEDAAALALGQRFEVVARALPLAIHAAEADIEHVHQLRVATRRADACLRIFRDCLPGAKCRAARARLRVARRAAGEARDGDVFLASLRAREAEAKSADLAGLDFLVGFTLGQRQVAQRQLESAEAQSSRPFEATLAKLLAAVRPPHDGIKTLDDLARPTLSTLLGQFTAATRENLGDYAHLHQVRIAGKRLRYAIEILAGCFHANIRDRVYPQVEEMQETLGLANDSHVALVRLQALRRQLQAWPETWRRARAGVEKLLRFHQRRLPQQRKRFLTWLAAWRKLKPDAMLGEASLPKGHEGNGKAKSRDSS